MPVSLTAHPEGEANRGLDDSVEQPSDEASVTEKGIGGTYHRVARVTTLTEGQIKKCFVAGQRILLILSEDKLSAVLDKCPHEGVLLQYGRIRRGTIICAAHAAPFDLTTGICTNNLTHSRLTLFPVRIVEGWVEVAMPDRAATQTSRALTEAV